MRHLRQPLLYQRRDIGEKLFAWGFGHARTSFASWPQRQLPRWRSLPRPSAGCGDGNSRAPRKLRIAILTTALLTASVLLGGCGGGNNGSDSDDPKPTIRNASPWTEQQVIAAAGLTTDNGLSYESAACDQVAVILTSKNAVDTYAEAGDTVVTNPDGTAGVKVIGADAACLADLERGLAGLE